MLYEIYDEKGDHKRDENLWVDPFEENPFPVGHLYVPGDELLSVRTVRDIPHVEEITDLVGYDESDPNGLGVNLPEARDGKGGCFHVYVKTKPVTESDYDELNKMRMAEIDRRIRIGRLAGNPKALLKDTQVSHQEYEDGLRFAEDVAWQQFVLQVNAFTS